MNTRLQNFLNAENITQSQLADTIGVARASISHILSGRNKPGFDFIESLAKKYPQLNLEWLITGKGKMYNSPAAMPVKTPEIAESRTIPNPDDENKILKESSENNLFASEPIETPADDATEPFSAPSDSPSVPKESTQIRTADNPIFAQIPSSSPKNGKKSISQIIIYYEDNTYEIVY